ncbi:MAG: GNAT family N-acetyltransferase [Amaricoccus sp.]
MNATPEVTLRPARREDAADLARLGQLASGGLAGHLWARAAAPGEDPFAVGVARAARDEADFSWRNAVIAEAGGTVAGGLVIYRIAASDEPLDELSPIVRPLVALERRVPGTQYVNILATFPAFRRRGVATGLLAEARRRAAGGRGLSLIVADGNCDARRLYAAAGFVEAARAAMVKEDWESPSREWVLMVAPAS